MINITVTTNLGSLTQSFDRRIPAALRAVESAVLMSCGPFVPYNTGELYRSGHASGDGMHGEVTWSASHAGECYYANREFNRKHHPHACARWFEAAKAVDGGKWAAAAAGVLSSSSVGGSGASRVFTAGGR